MSLTSFQMFGGGPLSQAVGDYLADAGVKVINCYGLSYLYSAFGVICSNMLRHSTETGALSLFIPGTLIPYLEPNLDSQVSLRY